MENLTKPILTIGLPLYNDIKFIKRTLNSILNQSFTDFILHIADDYSTDGSADVCKKYMLNDKRIVYERHTRNIGISRNMEYLLHKAKSKYFIWAGDDDIMHPKFVETLILGMEQNSHCIVGFTPTVNIDENDKIISKVKSIDYSGKSPYERIRKLITTFEDACGYGIFLREKIQDVKFPVWIWPNSNLAYNNIYPTICYYLSKGDYVLMGKEPLFFNRIKEPKNINHIDYLKKYLFRGWMAFIIWKINLVLFSFHQIKRGKNIFFALKMFPELVYFWFWRPFVSETKHRMKFFKKYR